MPTDDIRTREICALLSLLVKAMITDQSAAVVVAVPMSDRRTVLQIRVAERDRGKVLGRNGRIARSLRVILLAISREQGGDYLLDIPSDSQISPCLFLD